MHQWFKLKIGVITFLGSAIASCGFTPSQISEVRIENNTADIGLQSFGSAWTRLDVSKLGGIVCPEGSSLFGFGLSKLNFQLQKNETNFVNQNEFSIVDASSSENVFVETCTNFSTLETKLARVVYARDENSDLTIIQPNPMPIIVDMSEAMFNPLSLDVRLGLPDGKTFLLKGWQTPTSSGFFTASIVESSLSNQLSVIGGRVLVGRLELGNPFQKCMAQVHQIETFKWNDARFELEKCSQMGTSGGSIYEIVGLRVTDSNPLLKDDSNVSFTIQGDNLKKFVRNKIRHHNDCDNLVIDLPHATYSATMGNQIDNVCSEVLPLAPAEPASFAILYKVNNTKITGKLGRGFEGASP